VNYLTTSEVQADFDPIYLAMDALGKVDDKMKDPDVRVAHAIQGFAYAFLAQVLLNAPQKAPEAPSGDPGHQHVFFLGSDSCATCGATYEETVEHQHRLTFDTAGTGYRQCADCGERVPVEKAEAT
jgi:DNA-directed RNA polymerase subunit RPC12/RpoP